MKKVTEKLHGGGVNRTLALLLCLLMVVAMVPASTTVAHATELPESAVVVVWYTTINDNGNVYAYPSDGQVWLYSELTEGGSLQSLSDYVASIQPIGADDAVYISNNPDSDMVWGETDTETEGMVYYCDWDLVDDSKYTWTSADPTATVPITNGQGQVVLYKIVRPVAPVAVDYSYTEFQTVLLLDANASVPAATMTYTIVPGTAVAATPGSTLAVLSPSAATGVTGLPVVYGESFATNDATSTSVSGVTMNATQKAVVKYNSVDFSEVTFSQPGIFRYIITEPSSGNNMTYDTQLNDTTNGTRYQRVLDVYVIRNASDEYEIGGYVLHEVAGSVSNVASAAADKSIGFVNEYNTTGLTLECQVEGNQSSIDKYFAYTITMQNPGNSAFNVTADWSNASGAQNPVANPATSYTNAVITAANTNEWTSNADGSMSKTIYLKDGQKVALDGIPVGTSYSVTVAEEDYGPSWEVNRYEIDTETGSPEYQLVDAGTTTTTGNRVLNSHEDDIFILTREGVVPTGVALSILPGVILMGAAAVFFFVMKNRKREEASEA